MVSKEYLDFLYAAFHTEKQRLDDIKNTGGLPDDPRIIGMHDQQLKDQQQKVLLLGDVINQYIMACNNS